MSRDGSAEGVDRDRASIAREHLLGATVWAYGGGGIDIKPWTNGRRVKMPGRLGR